MTEHPPASSPLAPGASDEPVQRCACGFELQTGQTDESRADQILRMVPATILDEMRAQRGEWLESEMRRHNPALALALYGAPAKE